FTVAIWLTVIAHDNGIVWAVGFLVFPAILLAAGLILLVLRLLNRLPSFFLWAVLCASIVVGVFCGMAGPLGFLAVSGVCVLIGSLIGASLWVFKRGNRRVLSRTQVIISSGGCVLGLGLLGLALWWAVDDGPAGQETVNAALTGEGPSSSTSGVLEDPSKPGPYRVLQLTYGSGSDRHRSEYAEGVAIRTGSVDGSRLIGRWSGRSGWARTRYWGFDAKELPLQARVWYPEGDGPFPLVLIVHGNHLMEQYSDPGYGYLGELMASRGFIFASVDENFLNGSPADLVGIPEVGLEEENDARGWLLLEHLRLWRKWNQTPRNVFHGRVDMDRIAVAGHSRGGEAAAVAGVFNRLPYYPNDARVAFDFGFNIRSIFAIAPVDGQFKPAGEPTRLENVNYFVLHGSWDSDMESFHGARVLERARFTGDGDWFKAFLYVHRANHGQFNSVWGRSDMGQPFGALLNTRPMISTADQQQIARAFISAYLEATLHDRREYRSLLRDWRLGEAWLPKTVYLQKYEASRSEMLATFEEDIDVTTTTTEGGRITAENLSDWKEKAVDLKWGGLDTRAVTLGWNRKEAPGPCSYLLQWPEKPLPFAADSVLFFSLAAAKDDPSSYQEEDGEKDEKANDEASGDDDATKKEPIDFTLELGDRSGNTARLPLSHFGELQPQIETQVLKAAFMQKSATSEVVYQTFEFPVAAFATVNPQLDTSALTSLRLIFDRSEKGVVILDGVGFRRDKD
ncbi:MAG: MFS transporter, partial [Acidobacteriota bacterium]